MRFVEKKSFLWRRFLLLKVCKFHHTMLVLNAFPAALFTFIGDCNNNFNKFSFGPES